MQIDRYVTEDEALGGWWTKLRDKVIKPVGRVVAAYYTGGASEIAFKANDMANAQKKAKAQQDAYNRAYGIGPTAVPSPYPTPNDPNAVATYYAATGQMPPTQPKSLPEWVLPAGAAVAALLVVNTLKKR